MDNMISLMKIELLDFNKLESTLENNFFMN